MKKAVLLILVFAMLIVGGCSSNDNRTFGSGAVPTPTPPEPEPIPRATVSARVVNPLLDGAAVANAEVVVRYSDGQVVKTTTDENGSFNIEIEAIPGEIVEIEFSKPKYSIKPLVVTVNPDGTLSYTGTVNASVTLDSEGVTYRIKTVVEMEVGITYSVLSPDEKYLYTVNYFNNLIYRVDLQAGSFTEIINLSDFGGDFGYPTSIAITSDGDTLYITHWNSYLVSKVTGLKTANTKPEDVKVTTIAGGGSEAEGNTGEKVQFGNLTGIALTADDNTLYVCDTGSGKIKKLTNLVAAQGPVDVSVTTVAQGFIGPYDLRLSGDEDSLYVVDYSIHTVSRITGVKAAGTEPLTPVTIAGTAGSSGDGDKFYNPTGIFANATGNVLFVADFRNYKIKKIENAANAQSASDVTVTVIAGTGAQGNDDGDGDKATFYSPFGIITNDDCTIAYITDNNYSIRRMIAVEN